MIATDYAKALYELGSDAKHLRSLRAVLERRGHLGLLPRIFSEYQKLKLKESRRATHAHETPERASVRTLLELYRKLTA